MNEIKNEHDHNSILYDWSLLKINLLYINFCVYKIKNQEMGYRNILIHLFFISLVKLTIRCLIHITNSKENSHMKY